MKTVTHLHGACVCVYVQVHVCASPQITTTNTSHCVWRVSRRAEWRLAIKRPRRFQVASQLVAKVEARNKQYKMKSSGLINPHKQSKHFASVA